MHFVIYFMCIMNSTETLIAFLIWLGCFLWFLAVQKTLILKLIQNSTEDVLCQTKHNVSKSDINFSTVQVQFQRKTFLAAYPFRPADQNKVYDKVKFEKVNTSNSGTLLGNIPPLVHYSLNLLICHLIPHAE